MKATITGRPRRTKSSGCCDQAAREMPGVKIRMGRLSDFSDAILKENPTLAGRAGRPGRHLDQGHHVDAHRDQAGPQRPSRRSPRWTRSDTLLPDLGRPRAVEPPKHGCRGLRGQPDVRRAHLGIRRQANCPRLYGKAWEQARAAGKYAVLEESWGEKAAYIRKAADATRAATTVRPEGPGPRRNVKGPRIVVFNPLPWPRDGMVMVQVPWGSAFRAERRSHRPGGSLSAGGASRFASWPATCRRWAIAPTCPGQALPSNWESAIDDGSGVSRARRQRWRTPSSACGSIRPAASCPRWWTSDRAVSRSIRRRSTGWANTSTSVSTPTKRPPTSRRIAETSRHGCFQDFAKFNLPPAKDIPHVTEPRPPTSG